MPKPISARNRRLFDKYYPIISVEVRKRKPMWQLHAIRGSMAWEDIEQILLVHIAIKINQWKPSIRPIERWLSSLIHNQILNLRRNYYYAFSSPCSSCKSCPHQNLGEECPEYIKWVKTKKAKHDIRLPVAMEDHAQEVFDKPIDNLNYDTAHKNITDILKLELNKEDYRIYDYLFVRFKTEDQTISLLKLSKGNRKVANTRKVLLDRIKCIIKECDIG